MTVTTLAHWPAAGAADDESPDDPEWRPLTYTERRILDFTGRYFATPGFREQTIRDEFGFGATVYYQKLNRLLDRPEARAHAPMLATRLRRIRESRRGARSASAKTGAGR